MTNFLCFYVWQLSTLYDDIKIQYICKCTTNLFYLFHFFVSFSENNYKVEAITNGYEISMRLTIRPVRPVDYGSFRCIATNSLGETDGKIKLYSEF